MELLYICACVVATVFLMYLLRIKVMHNLISHECACVYELLLLDKKYNTSILCEVCPYAIIMWRTDIPPCGLRLHSIVFLWSVNIAVSVNFGSLSCCTVQHVCQRISGQTCIIIYVYICTQLCILFLLLYLHSFLYILQLS